MVSVGGRYFIEDAPVEKWIVCVGCGINVGKYSVYCGAVSVDFTSTISSSSYDFGNGGSKVGMESRSRISVFGSKSASVLFTYWGSRTHVNIKCWPNKVGLRQIFGMFGLCKQTHIHDTRVLIPWILGG